MKMWLVETLTIVLILQRLSELVLSKRNARRAMARGGVEHGAEHFWMFVVLHVGWIIGMNVEWALGTHVLPTWWPAGVVVFTVMQVARYWVIRSLGEAWNARIITWPGMRRITTGPYRLLRHPNYVIVAIELAVVPLTIGALGTSIAATILNAVILLGVRIPAEERALRGQK